FISLLAIKIAIRVIWFFTAIALFVGNAKEYKKCLQSWQFLTAARIVFAIATCIYGIVKLEDDMQKLFKNFDPNNLDLKGYIAEFILMINFIELGPIWWIIFIAFMIFVFRRSQEIDTRKVSQVNQWGNFGNSSQANGNAANARPQSSALAHPVSLTQEPNPFTHHREEDTNNNNKRQTEAPVASFQPARQPDNYPPVRQPDPYQPPAYQESHVTPTPSAPEPSVQPILQINEVIAIPRVTLAPKPTVAPKPYTSTTAANVHRYEPNYDNRGVKYGSNLAQRSSYLEYDREREAQRAPKRNNSFNTAQPYQQRSRNYYSYDNRGYHSSEQDLRGDQYP
ncbi:unnamed protein product, partial [Oppiella nova]